MRKHFLFNTVLFIFLLAGSYLLLYPIAGNLISSRAQSDLISAYNSAVNDLSDAEREQLLLDALSYNVSIAEDGPRYHPGSKDLSEYRALLNIDGSGVMGYIEIPKIKCVLPICHGTDKDSLLTSVGHISWSSLPIGGESTHCVLYGHSGLLNAKLFSDLDELVIGDEFTLITLHEALTYSVDQILVIDSDEIDALQITRGMDFCSLVSCSPKDIDPHRLVVRGHRIDPASALPLSQPIENAAQISSNKVAAILSAAVLIILLLFFLLFGRKRRARQSNI